LSTSRQAQLLLPQVETLRSPLTRVARNPAVEEETLAAMKGDAARARMMEVRGPR
jgi:hypothetical protein